MHPLISVIVPIYKVEGFLNKCIDSILEQTYPHLEIILVDDGSPDACPQICDMYAERDARVQVVHKENGGLSSARNAGIRAATGDYYMFVDSDDYIEPCMAEKLLSMMLENNADLCICNFHIVDENGNLQEEPENTEKISNDVIDGQEATDRLVLHENGRYFFAWNKLYKKELFDTLSFKEGKINEDAFLMHHLFYKCTRICCTEEKLYNYLQRSDSIMHQTYTIKRLDNVEARIDQMLFFMEKKRFACVAVALRQAVGFLNRASVFLKDQEGKAKTKALKKEVYTLYLRIKKEYCFRLKEKIKIRLCLRSGLYAFLYKIKSLFQGQRNR